jgi:transposase
MAEVKVENAASREANTRLRDENVALRTENAQLRGENEVLRAERAENGRLRELVEQLREQVERLLARVQELERAGKRQAAPFSRNDPKPDPKRPGRKPGADYGVRARRAVPDRVDRQVDVPLPETCPHCGGRDIEHERVAFQYQEDFPQPRPTDIARYAVHIGRCRGCGRRVQPRHPDQTSDALGAAGVQLGPRAVALAAWLSKSFGLSASKIARLFAYHGLSVTPGGVTQAVARAGRRAAPTYAELVAGARASPVVAPDETGWRVNGAKAWLWAFVGTALVVYHIATGEGARGFGTAATVLGADYPGVLERDGWAPYRQFVHARHQSCLAHLLRRCRSLVAVAGRGQARTPRTVARLLRHALHVRDRRDAGQLSAGQVAAEATRLGAAIDALIAGRTRYRPNRRLLKHLGRERSALFTFLSTPGVQATNWRAEQAIRPAVVTRKNWGGNRTRAGAGTWEVLASVLTTAVMQHRDPVATLIPLLQSPRPIVADLTIPTRPTRGP